MGSRRPHKQPIILPVPSQPHILCLRLCLRRRVGDANELRLEARKHLNESPLGDEDEDVDEDKHEHECELEDVDAQ